MKLALSGDSFSPHVPFSVLALAVFFGIAVTPAFAGAQTPDGNLNAPTLVSLANADRAMYRLSALVEDKLLSAAAQKKADDMIAKGYFSHVGPGGQAPWYWFAAAGYYYLKAGENLAMDFSAAESVETAWMASPSHRANIMNGAYTRIGIGVSRGLYRGKETTFVVEFFAQPAPVAARTSTHAAVGKKRSGALARLP